MAIIISYPSATTVTTSDNLLGTQFDGESNANITKNFSVGKIVDLVSAVIPAGAQGPQGVQGVQGIQGAAGSSGTQGTQGSVGPQGVPGPVGPAGLEWRGSWVSGTSYIADDAVGYSGASYFCILATSGTTAPDLDTTHWALLAAEGLQGPAGTTGAQGPAGATGAQGIQGPQGVQGIAGVAGPWGTITGSILSQTDLQNQFATYVPTARTLTINGVTYDLSANRSWTVTGTGLVTSVFGRIGNVVATGGDYTTTLVTEGTNLYFTNARARLAISLTTTGTSGIATYNNATGVLNIPDYAGGTGIAWLESNATDLTVWNNGKGNINTNTSFGDSAFRSNVSGSSNAAYGKGALYSNTSGSDNTAIGASALLSNTFGSSNIAIGGSALSSNLSGNNNLAIGVNALVNNTVGDLNVANGEAALFSNTSGAYNIAVGVEALYSNVGGGSNVATGYQALYSNTSGGNNVANGPTALQFSQTGNNNTAIGIESGRIIGSGAIANVINNSVFLGAYTRPLNNSETNQIVIGYAVVGAGSNTVTLGNASIVTTQLRGDVITNGTITGSQFKLSALNTAPANASATGVTGEIRYDANYMYVCVATNTWKRSAITTWP